MQPFDYDANERNKHKFLVQTVFIDPVADYAEDGKTFQVIYMSQLFIFKSMFLNSNTIFDHTEKKFFLKINHNLFYFSGEISRKVE